MAKQSDYLKRLAQAQALRDTQVRDHQRTFVLDIVTIALGRFGMSPDDLRRFRDIYIEAEKDYREEILEDFYNNGDKKISYAKDRIDRAIKEYVPEDMFLPFDQRYLNSGFKR